MTQQHTDTSEGFVLMDSECAAWQQVVALLRCAGVVTTDTNGQRLLAAIRNWGEALVEMRGGAR